MALLLNPKEGLNLRTYSIADQSSILHRDEGFAWTMQGLGKGWLAFMEDPSNQLWLLCRQSRPKILSFSTYGSARPLRCQSCLRYARVDAGILFYTMDGNLQDKQLLIHNAKSDI